MAGQTAGVPRRPGLPGGGPPELPQPGAPLRPPTRRGWWRHQPRPLPLLPSSRWSPGGPGRRSSAGAGGTAAPAADARGRRVRAGGGRARAAGAGGRQQQPTAAAALALFG